jgi:hypothetical protein
MPVHVRPVTVMQDVFADAFEPGLVVDTFTAVAVKSNLHVPRDRHVVEPD